MVITAFASALMLASSAPQSPPPPPPPPPSAPTGGPHIKTFDGGSFQRPATPVTPAAPSVGLAPTPEPAAMLLPAIQKARDPAPRAK